MVDAQAPLRVAEYTRVSKDRALNQRSVRRQAWAAADPIEAHGWVLVEKFVDDDRSASRFAVKPRHDWDLLLGQLPDGRFDVVMLWESSRGDRRLPEWATFLDTCRRHGILIFITKNDRVYDVRRARDWKDLANEGVDSAFESEQTSERIKSDLAFAASLGKPHGQVPYGYTRRYDEETKELVEQYPHPEHAEIVREIFERVAAGHPVVTITKDFNARGVPSPRGGLWERHRIRRIALSPTYLGFRRHGDRPDLLKGNWPALVSAQLWETANAVLSDPARTTTRPGRARHLLSNLAHARCGGDISVTNKGTFYGCNSDGCAGVRKDWADGHVVDSLAAYLAADGVADALCKSDDAADAPNRERIAELRTELDRWRQAAKEERVSLETFAEIESDRLGKIRVLDQKLTARVHPLVLALLEGDRRAAAIRARFLEMPVAAQRAILRELVRVVIHPAPKRGRVVEFRPERVTVEPLV